MNQGYVVYPDGVYYARLKDAAKAAKRLSSRINWFARVENCSTNRTMRLFFGGHKKEARNG